MLLVKALKFHDPQRTMMEVSDQPLTQLSVLQVDASQPGTLTLTLDEHLCCQGCGRVATQWQITLGPAGANDNPTPRRDLRPEDPGG